MAFYLKQQCKTDKFKTDDGRFMINGFYKLRNKSKKPSRNNLTPILSLNEINVVDKLFLSVRPSEKRRTTTTKSKHPNPNSPIPLRDRTMTEVPTFSEEVEKKVMVDASTSPMKLEEEDNRIVAVNSTLIFSDEGGENKSLKTMILQFKSELLSNYHGLSQHDEETYGYLSELQRLLDGFIMTQPKSEGKNPKKRVKTSNYDIRNQLMTTTHSLKENKIPLLAKKRAVTTRSKSQQQIAEGIILGQIYLDERDNGRRSSKRY